MRYFPGRIIPTILPGTFLISAWSSNRGSPTCSGGIVLYDALAGVISRPLSCCRLILRWHHQITSPLKAKALQCANNG
jgi:hypothetical protein